MNVEIPTLVQMDVMVVRGGHSSCIRCGHHPIRKTDPLIVRMKKRVVVHSVVHALPGYFIVCHTSAIPNSGRLIGMLEDGVMVDLAQRF